MNKIFEIMESDQLVFHKLFGVLGAILGILLGLFVTAQADDYIFEIIESEVKNEETID